MILTPLEPEDLELLYTIENDRTIWCVGNNNVPYSRYALRDYIATQKHDIYADRQVRLVARTDMSEGGRSNPVGLFDIFNFSPEHGRAEVGFAILKAERGKGYAGQALHLLVEYARTVLHVHLLYAIVPAGNLPSLAMLRAEGFTNEHILRGWIHGESGWQDAVFMQKTFE